MEKNRSSTANSKTKPKIITPAENSGKNKSVENKQLQKSKNKQSQSKVKDSVVVKAKAMVDRRLEELTGHPVIISPEDLDALTKLSEKSITKRFRQIRDITIFDPEGFPFDLERIAALDKFLKACPNLQSLTLQLLEPKDETSNFCYPLPRLENLTKLEIIGNEITVIVHSQGFLKELKVEHNAAEVLVNEQKILSRLSLIKPEFGCPVHFCASQNLNSVHIENAPPHCIQSMNQTSIENLTIDGFSGKEFLIPKNISPKVLSLSNIPSNTKVKIEANEITDLSISKMASSALVEIAEQSQLENVKFKFVSTVIFEKEHSIKTLDWTCRKNEKHKIMRPPQAQTKKFTVDAPIDVVNPISSDDKPKTPPPFTSLYSMMKEARTTGAPAILAVVIAAFFGWHVYTRMHPS